MKKNLIANVAVGLIAVSFIFVSHVFAGPLDQAIINLDRAAEPTDLEDNITDTVAMIVKGLLALVGTIFLLLTIYAGILWMTASGNAEQVEKAQGIVKAAVIGLLITMSAYAITFFVTNQLGGAAGGAGGGKDKVPEVELTKCSSFPNGQCVRGTNSCPGPTMVVEYNTDCLQQDQSLVCCHPR